MDKYHSHLISEKSKSIDYTIKSLFNDVEHLLCLLAIQVVYGATLPLAPNHVPTLSFNDNGQYLGHIQILDQLEEGEDGEKENLEPPAKEQQTTFTSFTTSSSFPTVSIFGSSKLSTVGVLSSERLSLSSAPMFGQGSRDSGLPQGFARPFGPSQFSAEGAQAQLQVSDTGVSVTSYTFK